MFWMNQIDATRQKTISVNPQADMSALEGEIDQLVAPRQLYGLSEDEIAIVEGKA
jgi:hypothetical protein